MAGLPKNSIDVRKIIWTIHLHDFGFKMLIFPRCHGFESSSMDAIGKQNNQSAHHKINSMKFNLVGGIFVYG